MSLVITGATGHFGRLVVEELLARGVPAQDLVATGRAVERIEDLAARGVQVRTADYADPASLRAAFDGASTVLLVSGLEPDRAQQHRNAIDAAREAGVSLIVYTSIVNADKTTMQVAADHKATEDSLKASGVPYVSLRNSWYIDNYTAQLPTILEHGTVLGAAGDGRVSAATRADFAAAAAVVLAANPDDHANRVYELGGDVPFTLAELAAEIGAQTGKEIRYADLSEAEFVKVLIDSGAPAPYAAMIADADRGLSRGELATDSGDLSKLIGRPTTTLHDAIAAALREL